MLLLLLKIVFWALIAGSFFTSIVVWMKRTTEPDRSLALSSILWILAVVLVALTPLKW